MIVLPFHLAQVHAFVALSFSKSFFPAFAIMKEGNDVELAGSSSSAGKEMEQVEVDEVIAPETSQSAETGLAEVRTLNSTTL